MHSPAILILLFIKHLAPDWRQNVQRQMTQLFKTEKGKTLITEKWGMKQMQLAPKVISPSIYTWPMLRKKQQKFPTPGSCNLNNCHMVCVEHTCKYSAGSIGKSCHKLCLALGFLFFPFPGNASKAWYSPDCRSGLVRTQSYFYLCFIHVFLVYSGFLGSRNSTELQISGKGNLLTPFPLTIDAKPSIPVGSAFWECRTGASTQWVGKCLASSLGKLQLA